MYGKPGKAEEIQVRSLPLSRFLSLAIIKSQVIHEGNFGGAHSPARSHFLSSFTILLLLLLSHHRSLAHPLSRLRRMSYADDVTCLTVAFRSTSSTDTGDDDCLSAFPCPYRPHTSPPPRNHPQPLSGLKHSSCHRSTVSLSSWYLYGDALPLRFLCGIHVLFACSQSQVSPCSGMCPVLGRGWRAFRSKSGHTH